MLGHLRIKRHRFHVLSIETSLSNTSLSSVGQAVLLEKAGLLALGSHFLAPSQFILESVAMLKSNQIQWRDRVGLSPTSLLEDCHQSSPFPKTIYFLLKGNEH